MFPPFPQEQALALLRQMVADLRNGSLRMYGGRPGQGVMLGAMVCLDESGAEVHLKTLSGISSSLVPAARTAGEQYVPPIVPQEEITAALQKNDAEIHRLTTRITALRQERQARNAPPAEAEAQLAQERAALTSESLAAVYARYAFHCADGTVRTLMDICGDTLPPTGTGDCCAPKLLDYAFAHRLTPVSMCESLYDPVRAAPGAAPVPCPPCDARCGRILPAMLGLHILYRDAHIIVVNKQGGLLSVPGRGPDRQDCVVRRVRALYPASCGIEQPAVHRLDMETSGLMVLAFTREAHRALSRQFEAGTVHKEYEALIDGVLARRGIPQAGELELFFRLDVANRPHQIWDAEHGRRAVTRWNVLNVENYHAPDGSRRAVTRVRFTPLTGRTHQLRLASADGHGFGLPIIGDTLYGTAAPGERLMLHATMLQIDHPVSGAALTFTSPAPF